MAVNIIPLRNMVLVRFQDEGLQEGELVVIRDPKLVRPARVLAVGPEVRDIKPDMVALVNRVAGTSIGEQVLVPESAIVGTL